MRSTHTAIEDRQQSVLVTGGTSGLGRSLVSDLSRRGWHVVFTGRNTAAGRSLEDASPNPDPGCRHFLSLDQSDLAACIDLPDRIAALGIPPLAAIACNAGTQTVGTTVVTAQGLEATHTLNHLSHHLLVDLLLPLLQDHSRILVVSSGTHDPAQRTGMPAPELRTVWAMAEPELLASESPNRAGRIRYTTSKLCNMLFSYELARRLHGDPRAITVNALDPGLMPGSGLSRSYPRALQVLYRRLAPAMQLVVPNVNSPKTSARAAADLLSNPEYGGANGMYFVGTNIARSSAQSYDRVAARRLWTESNAFLGALGLSWPTSESMAVVV